MARRLFQYDPLISYKFIPSLKARIEHEDGGYLLKTNQLGFRSDHEFHKQKDPSLKRILLFGDSFTAGDGVSNGKRYSDFLEQMLPNTEIYNFGLPGTSTDQHYLIWKKYAPDIEYDLVVIGLQIHNINRIVARYRRYLNRQGETILLSKPYFTLDNEDEIRLQNMPVSNKKIPIYDLDPFQLKYVETIGSLPRLKKLIKKLGPKTVDNFQKILRFQPLKAYNKKTNPSWLLMKAILNQWAIESKKSILICPIPLYQYIEGISSPKNYQERFESLQNSPHTLIHDPLKDLMSYSQSERREFRFKVDQHFTSKGHMALAKSLLTSIKPILYS